MFRYRDFRRVCREEQISEIIEILSKRLSFDAFNDYFLCTTFLSELINKNEFSLSPQLLNFLYSFPSIDTPKIKLKKDSRRLGVFIKDPETFPVELYSCINKIYKTPVAILIGENQQNTDYAEFLQKIDIPARVLSLETDLQKHLENIKNVCEEEKFYKVLIHANPADLEYLLLSRSIGKGMISYHKSIPLVTEHTYCEQEDSLGKGSWKINQGLPLHSHYSSILVPAGESFPTKAFELLEHEKILLLNPDPLDCLKNLTEDQIEKVILITDPKEYPNGLKFCNELMVMKGLEEDCFDLALKWGLPLKFIDSSEKFTYQEALSKFSLRDRFTQVLTRVLETKQNFRKSLPRILFFRNDKTAPIISAINRNISAALKNTACPLLEIDIIPMIKASKAKDWEKVISIQRELRDRIDHFKPDQALGYNDTGIFQVGDSHMLEQMGIPYNGLFFDNPLYFMHNLKHCQNKDLIRIFTLDEFFIAPLKEGGFHETYYMPIATSIHHRTNQVLNHFDSNKLIFTATVKKRFSAEEFVKPIKNKNDKDFMYYAYNEINDHECFSLNELLAKYKHFYTKDYVRFHNEVWFHIDNQCSSILRLKTVESLQDYELDIYGGDNWGKVELSPKHTYKGYMNYRHLPDAYKTSFATICRTPLNIQNGIQQRILDCAAAKGLIIADYRPILEEHFKLDKELFVYRNGEELKEKIQFLKNNPAAAEKSKRSLHKKVIKQHTWDKRIQEIINYMM